MASYKEPSFAERTELARQAREKALAKLQSRPAPDPAVVAARIAAQTAKLAAEAERRAAQAQARADKAAARAAAIAAAKPAPKVELTEAEKKAQRDARYAARKGRK